MAEEEEAMDTSSLMLIIVYGLAFVTPYFRKIYVEFFTAEGAALRKKQMAEKEAAAKPKNEEPRSVRNVQHASCTHALRDGVEE